MKMNFHEWREKLDELGSALDPIEYNGVSTTPDQMAYSLMDSIDSVAGVRIRYFDGFRKKWVTGTCLQMLKERMRPEKKKKRQPTLKAEHVIIAIDAGLEGDNRHSESASAIWAAIKRHIPKDRRLKAAEALGDSLGIDWKDTLQYVAGFGDDE